MNKYCFGPKTHAHPFILRKCIVIHGTGWLQETLNMCMLSMHWIMWSVWPWQILTFTAHWGNNVYIPQKYSGGICLCMVFMLQETGMPTWSFLKRFEPFNLWLVHNQCNLDFAVEQTCTEISYYPQFCSWIQLPYTQFRHNCCRSTCFRGCFHSIWPKISIWCSNTILG